MRAGADTSSRFVAELYDDAQHGNEFDAFLHSDKVCMFVILTFDRAFRITLGVPQCGSYVSLLYILKPTSTFRVKWSAASLATMLQVFGSTALCAGT
jgi:hypothetical protein